MARAEIDIRTDLNNLSLKMMELANGDRVTTFITGSGEFQRRYTFQECTLQDLQKIKSILEAELAAILPSTWVFRKTSLIPMIVRKGIH
jgi:hypothetical protein